MDRFDAVNTLWFGGWLVALAILFALGLRLPLQPRLRRLPALGYVVGIVAAEALVQKVTPGSIVCLHDAIRSHPDLMPRLTRQPHADREAMLTALDMFLTHVGSRLRFITVPELLRSGSPQRQHWYRVTPLAPRSSEAS